MRQRALRADSTLRAAATLVAVTCAMTAFSGRASATPTPRGATSRMADVDRKAADALVKDALAFERQGHLKPATDRLERAVQLHDAIAVRLHLARTLEEQGKLVLSLESYHAAFALPPITTEDRDAIAVARVRAEELAADLPRVSFVGTLPDSAKVTLDGENVLDARGRTLTVDPGEHVVVVDAPGRALWRTKFQVTRGDAREIGVQAGPDVGLRPDLLPPSALVADDRPAPGSSLPSSLKPAPLDTESLLGDRRLRLSRSFYVPDVHAVTSPSAIDLAIPAPPIGERSPPFGRVVLRDCALVPCTDRAGEASPQGGYVEKKEERVDKRIWSSLTGTGVNLMATQGFVLLTAPALAVPNARFGASMMPNGSKYVALTGLW